MLVLQVIGEIHGVPRAVLRGLEQVQFKRVMVFKECMWYLRRFKEC